MYTVANNVMVVGKSKQVWDDGTATYRLQVTNGSGELVTIDSPEGYYEQIVPLDKRYDMEIDFYTRGYKTYSNLVAVAEH